MSTCLDARLERLMLANTCCSTQQDKVMSILAAVLPKPSTLLQLDLSNNHLERLEDSLIDLVKRPIYTSKGQNYLRLDLSCNRL